MVCSTRPRPTSPAGRRLPPCPGVDTSQCATLVVPMTHSPPDDPSAAVDDALPVQILFAEFAHVMII